MYLVAQHYKVQECSKYVIKPNALERRKTRNQCALLPRSQVVEPRTAAPPYNAEPKLIEWRDCCGKNFLAERRSAEPNSVKRNDDGWCKVIPFPSIGLPFYITQPNHTSATVTPRSRGVHSARNLEPRTTIGNFSSVQRSSYSIGHPKK